MSSYERNECSGSEITSKRVEGTFIIFSSHNLSVVVKLARVEVKYKQ